MAGYIGSKASVVSSGAERKKTFTITGATTSLTGLNYTVGKVHVFQNGVRLVDGTDYTATNGTTITLTVAAQSGDNVVVISQAAYQVADAVLTSGDSMTGDLSLGDNNKVIFGAGSDLQIYHSGSHSVIKDAGDGNLQLIANDFQLRNGADNANMMTGANGGAVTLMHNGSSKLATTSTGVDVTGTVTSTGLIANVPTNTGLTINSTDVSAIQFNIANGSQKNWGFASTLTAAGDFGLYQSNSNGGNPVTAGTARLYVDSSGRLLVGRTNATFSQATGMVFYPNGTAYMERAGDSALIANRFTNNGPVAEWCRDGTQVGSVSVTGSSTAYNTSSDYRLKENVVDLTGASARVNQLNP